MNLIDGEWQSAQAGETYTRANPARAPFGGWNLSGGPFPEAGAGALDFFTRRKTVAMSANLVAG
jgi:acyl-CoA reductase-like NAD-dependent aldehyde dehydrogenase